MGLLDSWLEGLDENEKQQAIGMGLMNIGTGMLANNQPGGNPFAGAFQGAQQAAAMPQQMRQQKMQALLMQLKQQEAQRGIKQQEARDAALASMPEGERNAALLGGDAYWANKFKPREPVKVGYGEKVIDPTNGRVVAQGEDDPTKFQKVIGNTLFDTRSGKPVYTAPQQYAPSEFQRDLALAGIDPKSPEGQALIRQKIIGGDKTFDRSNTLRDEFNSLTKDYRIVTDAYRKIEGASKADSAAGDMSMVFGFMKLQDPGSTVREGEYATAENARGVPEGVLNVYNKVLTGQRLTPDQREDFKRQAAMMHRAASVGYGKVKENYTGIAKKYNLSPNDVVTDYGAVDYGDSPVPPAANQGEYDYDPVTKKLVRKGAR